MQIEKNISLRKAEASDIEGIKEILFGSLHDYKIPLPDNYSVSDIDNIPSDNNDGTAFVLLRYNVVIGFVILRPITNDCIELKRLYLTSSEKGKGLGKFLLKRSINYAREANYKYIRLETTSKFKEAVSLYRKYGFVDLPDIKKAPGHDLACEKKF